MVAQSVTGTGPGSAARYGLGPSRKIISADNIIGPKVVLADYFQMQDSVETRVYPKLEGSSNDYIIQSEQFDPESGNAGGSNVNISMTIDNTSTQITVTNGWVPLQVGYAVIKKGTS